MSTTLLLKHQHNRTFLKRKRNPSLVIYHFKSHNSFGQRIIISLGYFLENNLPVLPEPIAPGKCITS